VAAYTMAREADMAEVPVTVKRSIEGMEGSIQSYIDVSVVAESPWGRAGMHAWQEIVGDSRDLQIKKMAFFDYLIFNTDRHQGNFIYWFLDADILARMKPGQGSGVVGIDNGAAFQMQNSARGKTPPLIDNFPKDVAPYRDFFEALRTKLTEEKIRDILKEHFSEEVIQQTILRRARILDHYQKM